jgi:hypothetical protein
VDVDVDVDVDIEPMSAVIKFLWSALSVSIVLKHRHTLSTASARMPRACST